MTDTTALEFDLGDGQGVTTLRSWDAVDDWVSDLSKAWETFLRTARSNDPWSTTSIIDSKLAELKSAATNARHAGQQPSDLRGHIEGHVFGSHSEAIFHHDGVIGRRLLEIESSLAPGSGTFAFAFLRGRANLSSARNPMDLRAAMLLAMPDVAPLSDVAERLDRERANIRTLARTLMKEVETHDNAREESWRILASHSRAVVRRFVRLKRRSWEKSFERWSADGTTAVQNIRAVENTYRQAMALQAPVEYWNMKANRHEIAEKKARNRLLWFFPIVSILLFALFASTSLLLLSQDSRDIPSALYVIISAGLASIAGLTFWAGRLLTKLYLSEHHLRNDAQERAVMTTTYLALTQESGADKDDRHIVLSALFRTTPDGIVKDDGPPDLSVPALLSRLGGR